MMDRWTTASWSRLFRAVVALAALPSTLGAEVDFDSATFGGLRARSIGPAIMSGRVAAVDAVAEDPVTVYVGAASGGVWKSVDGALTFKPVFDDHPQSIGAIKIDPSDPETVWVGTGEPWTRNTVSVGFGVYKTTDGGENWEHVGLGDTERISTIRVDPTDGDVVYVCATGHLWNANEERGVFKTTDGGETWEKVLYVDEDTGCADIDVDPQEPRILYAAMWQFRRYPDFFNSGGPGSALYKSTDGGASWKEIENGLPAGELGRMAVAVAPSRPSVVYATVEAEEDGGLYRSEDLGETWTKVNAGRNITIRPFYFSELVVDPTDHRRVYKPGLTLSVSIDGGDSFTGMFGAGFSFGSVHSDHHALWINPSNPHELILGTDGGLYMSYDRAFTWRHIYTLPISQFYHVAHDSRWPYNVFGGLQDNQSWIGPSRMTGGIRNQDWDLIGTGDGFWVFADPEDPNVLYSEYQGGQLLRVHQDLGEVKSIKPFPEEDQPELRFNWNTPIHLSPNDPKTIYYGSQFVHRSRDRGDSWETISPDLTTNDPARQRQKQSGGLTIDNSTAENNATVYSISESPRNAQVMWTGSDDGQLYVTRDAGGEWTHVSGNVPDVPANTWISSVVASPHDEAAAFVTFDGHRDGDMTSYVYRTGDFGATWTSIANDVEGYTWVIKQDPVNADLLYLGTELGLYISLNGGAKWARFKENLPKVAVHDLVIHPTEHDVILATHGRGIYIIDDVTPLRALTREILDADVVMLPSRDTPMTISNQLMNFSPAEFVGETIPEAATIDYYLKKRHLFGDFKIEVFDGAGELVANVPGGKRKGLNRAYWAMRLKPPKMPPATNLVFAFQGPKVLEGTYKVRLTKGKKVLESEVELVGDPRSPHSAEDRRQQQETALEIYDRMSDLTYLVELLIDLTDQSRKRAEELERKGDVQKVEVFADRLDEYRTSLVSTSEAGMLSGDEKMRENLGNLFGEIVRYEGRPTDSQIQRKEFLISEFQEAEGEIGAYLDRELPAVNALLEKRGLEPLERQSREEWEAEESASGTASLSRLGPWMPFLAFARPAF